MDNGSARPLQDLAHRLARTAARSPRAWLAAGGLLSLCLAPAPAQARPAQVVASRSPVKAPPAPPATPEKAQPSAATASPASPAATVPATPPDADTLAELRQCQTSPPPGQAVLADSHIRPALVVGRRRVFDRVQGYLCIPPYAISQKPVTQAQYESVVGVRPHGADFAPERPVFVSFLQAAQYCNTVSLRERLTPCYQLAVDKTGKKTVAWPNRKGCTGYRLPAVEEAAAYERGTESEWTWVSSTLPLGLLDARNDSPRGFYLARNTAAPALPTAKTKAKR